MGRKAAAARVRNFNLGRRRCRTAAVPAVGGAQPRIRCRPDRSAGLSAATISNHIAKLRGGWGSALSAGRRGFRLTGDGIRIHDASLSLFRSIDNFSGIVGWVRGELAGHVYFGTVDAMYATPASILREALRKFHHPRTKGCLTSGETASPQQLQQRLGRHIPDPDATNRRRMLRSARSPSSRRPSHCIAVVPSAVFGCRPERSRRRCWSEFHAARTMGNWV